MRELDEKEVEAVGGEGIAYDLGFWIGDAIGGAWNSAMERMYNAPFQRQFG